jgi:hypothetical protein
VAGHVDGGQAHPSAGTEHQDRLSWSDRAPSGEGEPGRAVALSQCRRRRAREVVGNGGEAGGRYHHVAGVGAQPQRRQHPVAHRRAGHVLTHGHHRPGQFAPRGEGRGHLDLIAAGHEQGVHEVHPCRWASWTCCFEYQGKQFFASFDIPVSPGEAVTTVDDAVAAAERHRLPGGGQGAGPRGWPRQGRRRQARQQRRRGARARRNILGLDIKGHIVKIGLGRGRLRHRRGVLRQLHPGPLGQEAPGHALGQGGVEIEAVAERPRRHRQDLDRPGRRADREVARDWVEAAKLNPAATDGAVDILKKLYRAYTEGDADLTEINPLILKPTGEVHALDAKVTLDGNAGLPPRDWDVRGHPGPRRARAGRPRQGPAVRRPRRHRRHHRQRRRPGHVHRRRRQPGRRQARQLPRHRRRRQRRRDGRRARGHQQRPQREVHLHQHLRWHHPGEEVANGIVRPSAASDRRPDRHPPRRHQRRSRVGRSSPSTSRTSCRSKPTMLEAARTASSSPVRRNGERQNPWRSSSTRTPRSSTRA